MSNLPGEDPDLARFRSEYVPHPEKFVARLYPPSAFPAELCLVPVLQNGQEAGRWHSLKLSPDEYGAFTAALIGAIETITLQRREAFERARRVRTSSDADPAHTTQEA